jgi:hypothetical protein
MKLETLLEKIVKRGPVISADELERGIQEIEERVGVKIPSDFRSYLAAYGRPFGTRPLLVCPSTESDETFDIMVFYGIRSDRFDILKEWISFDNRFPIKCIPIGHNIFGDSYLYDLSDSNEKVYIWLHEQEVNEKMEFMPYYSNMILLANSFTEFLSRLTPEVYDGYESQ